MTYLLLQGTFHNLNSYTIVNNRLAAGLEKRGYRVFRAPTDRYERIGLGRQPDIYLTHDYPYDVSALPGRLNMMLLNYEYPVFMPQDQFLVDGINSGFDVLITPSQFSRQACLRSGITIPVEVCGYGFDPTEFNPHVSPVDIASHKSFRFINLGGAFDRKGTDILIRAYVEEFNAADDVVLIIKAFSYPQWREWVDSLLAVVQKGPDTPEIIFEHSEPDSVAGYFAAADVGVFPYRGEGYGLTILECLASGTPVIVTGGGSTDDFCTADNATLIESTEVTSDGVSHLLPDLDSLKSAMRAAYNRGKTASTLREHIHHTVSHLTWDHAVDAYKDLFDRWLQASPHRSEAPANMLAFGDFTPPIWNDDARHILASLPASHLIGKKQQSSSQVVIGYAGHSGGLFHRAAKESIKVLIHDGAPLHTRMALDEIEWTKAGIPALFPRRYASLPVWQHAMEYQLADYIVTFDALSYAHLARHFDSGHLKMLPPPLPQSDLLPASSSDILTYVFIGIDPFRRGIRLLFEAWRRATLSDARLLCLLDEGAYASPDLLKILVRTPSIEVRHLQMGEDYTVVFAEADFQVLPALEDGMLSPAAHGLSRGVPLIVSSSAGLSTIIEDGFSGHVVPDHTVQAWADAFQLTSERRGHLGAMRKASHDLAEQYTYTRFETALREWVAQLDG